MLSADIPKFRGDPASSAEFHVSGGASPAAQEVVVRVDLFDASSDNYLESAEVTVTWQNDTKPAALAKLDVAFATEPFFHTAVVSGSILAIEPEIGFYIGIRAWLDGVEVAGSAPPDPQPGPDPDDPVGVSYSSAFQDAAQVTARAGEVLGGLNAFMDGGNWVAGNNVGIGISTANPDVDTNSWTLLDQNGATRVPQHSGTIGGSQGSQPIEIVTSDEEGNVLLMGNAELNSLPIGWEYTVTP